MTGLNLETFLRLLRADLGAWLSLGLVLLVLAVMVWTNWGSRRALRKCLVLSVVLHVGLVLYGSTLPSFLPSDTARRPPEAPEDRIRQIRVAPVVEQAETEGAPSPDGRPARRLAAWDRPQELLAWNDQTLRPSRPEPPRSEVSRSPAAPAPPPEAEPPQAPEVNPPEPPRPESRPAAPDMEPAPQPGPLAPGDPSEIARPVVPEAPGSEATDPASDTGDRRLRPDRGQAAVGQGDSSRRPPAPLPLPDPPAPEGPSGSLALETRPEPPSVVLAPEIAPTAPAPLERDAIPRTRARPGMSGPSEPLADVPGESSLRDRVRRARGAAGSPATGSGPGTSPLAPGRLTTAPGRELAGRARPASEPAQDGSDTLVPEANVRQRSRAARVPAARPAHTGPVRNPDGLGPIALSRVAPSGPAALSPSQSLIGRRPLAEIPPMYRPRLDPNRSAAAQRVGATPASEQAVERALDWLARHQDADGRWNGGSARPPVAGLVEESRESFTAHCPPNDICSGECLYAEADTALTGLALLAYLGAGYTHTQGKYAATIGKGLQFLLLQQKQDGDLRGPSQAVGMYCHAMAALALSEAYALTGDERLRGPVERAVEFLVESQAADGMSWRYDRRAAVGDTSILGWVVLVLRSAKAVSIRIPSQAQTGAQAWLQRVSAGRAGGLASYQPFKDPTETMTAEAWVCRQLLGTGGPGPASMEAAEYLLTRGPERGPYNLYYWYYGTLAMYQYGGNSWSQWNQQVRDQLVRRQRSGGHASGSWDPDDDRVYGARGGRIYSTALATLTLEVYYRYLRFYDEPGPAPMLAPAPDPTDPSLRRAGGRPPRGAR